MKKFKTRLFFSLLLMAISFNFAFAATKTVNVDKLRYTINTITREATVNGLVSANESIDGLIIPDILTYDNVKYKVTAIKDYAFKDKINIKGELKLSQNLTSIGTGAFQGCINISGELVLPDAITSMGNGAFNNCSNLTGLLRLPPNLKKINYGVFWGCKGFTKIIFPEISETSDSYTIEANSFNGCVGLTGTLVVPSGVIWIGYNAFEGCGYDTVIFNEGLESIYSACFYGNNNLETIIISSTVTSISKYVFAKCGNLKTIICKAKKSPDHSGREVINNGQGSAVACYFSEKYKGQTVGGFPYNAAMVYVPKESLADYKKAFEWQAFSSLYAIPDFPEQISINPGSTTLKVGEAMALEITTTPLVVVDNSITWSCSDENIVSVSETGVITALSVGEATVYARSANNMEVSCQVAVTPILIESITLDPNVWNGVEGEKFQISTTLMPDNATDKSLEWTSSDETVATVDNTGIVSVLKDGSCVITARTVDGSDLYAECVISSMSGVSEIFVDVEGLLDIYDIQGKLIYRNCDTNYLKMLSPGIYILRTGDSAKKLIIY